MKELRDVRIVIGTRSYSIRTALNESELSEVVSLLSDVSKRVGDSLEQENLLLLTSLQLAYSMGKVLKQLEVLLADIGSTDSV